jgi:Putative restriction endonuclease
MQAVDLDFDSPVDPDEVTVPESPEHRRVVELIAATAALHLPVGTICYRNMNWYPLDGRDAVAPDVMTLPVGAVERPKRSYRQGPSGPLPGAVVEVPSESDSFEGFRGKLFRYQRLTVPAYVVTNTGPFAVLRLGPDNRSETPWAGKPIAELGGIAIDSDDDGVFVRMPDGQTVRRVEDITMDALGRAAEAESKAAESRAETDAARERVAQLEARLRALGDTV